MLKLTELSAPCEPGKFVMGLHVAHLAPGDPRFNISTRGIGPVDTLEAFIAKANQAISDLQAIHAEAQRMLDTILKEPK